MLKRRSKRRILPGCGATVRFFLECTKPNTGTGMRRTMTTSFAVDSEVLQLRDLDQQSPKDQLSWQCFHGQ